MEILIGILCIPAGLLALLLIVALFYLIGWLFEHGLFPMMFCGGLCGIFGCVASMIVGATTPTIFIVSVIVGAVIGLLLYVHFSLEDIKEKAKDDNDDIPRACNKSCQHCVLNKKCFIRKNGR